MRIIFSFSMLLLSITIFAQNKTLAIQFVDTLTSEHYAGRGYVNQGHKKSADFIAKKFKEYGLVGFNSDYKQEFLIDVNTFGGKADILIDKKLLFAGVDFIVAPNCPEIKGKFNLVWLNPKIVGNQKKMIKFMETDFKNAFLIIDKTGITDTTQINFLDEMTKNPFNAKGIVIVSNKKFTWGMSQTQSVYPVIFVNKSLVTYKNKKIELNINAKLKKDELTQNVLGYVEGSEQPDSFIVFSAHYDHLGMLGPEAIFTGANDNASGTAMLLDLVRHYSLPENKPKVSILFIAFGAEEVGLLGSKYYVNKPYFPLRKIKLQINTDIMGTGDEGIKIVNGDTHTDIYNLFRKINEEKGYLTKIGKRGKAANSDHHPFDEKGVKAIFIYTLGGSKAYHDVYDTADNLTLSKYNEVFKLITDFISEYK